MQFPSPSNAADVERIVQERLKALEDTPGLQETVNVEWRGTQRALPVISMPVKLLRYNPATHRVRAQRSLDAAKDHEVDTNPFMPAGQDYLHKLLVGDPADPSKQDPSFEALKEDLRQHGQNEPGIITRAGVLINGNTRRAALGELDQEHMRVAVLPPDAALDDFQSIELALQLRKDFKRDYSFMNFLLAIDERVQLGRPAIEIQRDFRIQGTTLERSKWILQFIREGIERSTIQLGNGRVAALRLVDFETHQGKLEELYRAYTALKAKSPDDAEALREQRLIALILGKSKTDLRLIEQDFSERYLPDLDQTAVAPVIAPVKIPGTSITARPPAARVQALRAAAGRVLQAKAIDLAGDVAPQDEAIKASRELSKLVSKFDSALDHAGRTGRLVKRRFAAIDRLGDANDSLQLAVDAVAAARASNAFNPEDLDEPLLEMRKHLVKLGQLAAPSGVQNSGGIAWLRGVAAIEDES